MAGLLDRAAETVARAGATLLDLAGFVRSARDRAYEYPTARLTPEKLVNIFRVADQGELRSQGELIGEMLERDAHLQSVVAQRRSSAMSRPREVVAADDTPAAAEAAGFVEEALRYVPFLGHRLGELWFGNLAGYAVQQMRWTFAAGKFWIEDLVPIPRSRFRADVEDELLLVTDENPRGDRLDVRHPAEFLVLKKPGPVGSICRPEVMRTCAAAYMFKRFAIQDWHIFAERYGVPMRYSQHSRNATTEEKKAALSALVNLGTDGAALLPEGFPVNVLEARGGGTQDVHGSLASFWNAEMSKSVVGQTLTTEAGDKGARSLGLVHQVGREALVDQDVEILEETLQRGLVRWLVEFNFPPGTPCPQLRIQRSSTQDLDADAKRMSVLVNELGMQVPVEHAHKIFGIPRAEAGEDVLTGRGAAAPTVPPPPLNEPDGLGGDA